MRVSTRARSCVEGPGLLAEAIAGGWDVETVYVDDRADPALVPSGIDVRHLGRGVLERVATTETPQPILAVVRQRDDRCAPSRYAALVLVADGINDPGNLGTMLRSAEAAGFDAVVTTPGTVDAYNPKVLRASAGAIFHVRVVVGTLDEVRAAGLRLVGTSSHTGTDHTGFDWRPPVAIVVGSEAHGLADDAPVDDWVRITHAGRAESLNVAMAATPSASPPRRPPPYLENSHASDAVLRRGRDEIRRVRASSTSWIASARGVPGWRCLRAR
ncbi:MAG: RNA methyltransferase [Ilumatobacteraceae bacterium]